MRTKRKHRGAFTLRELLVVVAVIAVVLAILVPVIQSSRETARRNCCSCFESESDRSQ